MDPADAAGLDREDPFVILPAANALDHLGEWARPAIPAIRDFLEKEPDPGRFESKLPVWLLTGTLQDLEN